MDTKTRLIKRAVDLQESAASTSFFLASGFSCSQALSMPAHTQVTQTVRMRRGTMAVNLDVKVGGGLSDDG